jgi:hypothetical protein
MAVKGMENELKVYIIRIWNNKSIVDKDKLKHFLKAER